MSAELVVKNRVAKTITSDWKYSIGAGEEKATLTGSYKDNFAGWQDRCPVLNSDSPDIAGMKLVHLEANREEGDVIKVDLKYEATLHSNAYPGRHPEGGVIKRYAFAGSDGEEHILTHTRYAELDATEQKALFNISNGTEGKEESEGGGSYADDVYSELGLECLAKIRKGTVARKSTGMIWIEKYTTDDLTEIDRANILKTMLPPGKAGELGDIENWLYLTPNATEEAEGEVFALEKRWEYSANGWDLEMYPPAS
jgi:hypothetical protein